MSNYKHYNTILLHALHTYFAHIVYSYCILTLLIYLYINLYYIIHIVISYEHACISIKSTYKQVTFILIHYCIHTIYILNTIKLHNC